MENSKRVAVYVRVSTSDQKTELQLYEIREYCLRRGWSGFEVYEDKASGTSTDRVALTKLLSDVRAKRVDLVICWKLDRFFRSLKSLVVTLQELAENNVEFIAIRDNIDMTTSSGRLMTHIIGAFAEFEASIIRERVKAGLQNARAKGVKLGRRKTRDDARIHAMRARGFTQREISKHLGISIGSVNASLATVKTKVTPGQVHSGQ